MTNKGPTDFRGVKARTVERQSKPKNQAAPRGKGSDDDALAQRRDKLLKDRIETLHKILKFKQFLGASFEPTISDSEIIVCFADVRGFTDYCRELQQEMQDRKIQNFLREYVKIFTEGLVAWYVKWLDPEYGEPRDYHVKIADFMMPSMYKNLGDGLMMVWEIPPQLDLAAQGNLSQQIVVAIQEMQERFYYRFRELSPVELDCFSKRVLDLEQGIGIAKGHAWRLDYGNAIDYAGSIINLASRLESCARPAGIVAHYDVSSWLFNWFAEKRIGQIVTVNNMKGYPAVKAWISPAVDSTQTDFSVLATTGKPRAGKKGR